MKKSLFILFSVALAGWFSSCSNDGCSLEGTWKVKSVDIQTEKLSEAIVDLMEQEYLNTTYVFSNDGNLTLTTVGAGQSRNAKWTKDNSVSTLSIEYADQQQGPGTELNDIINCSESSMKLSQRIPNDSSLDEMATVILQMERITAEEGDAKSEGE